MAQPILDWLQTEAGLTKVFYSLIDQPIENFEKEFSSGYSLAEVLNNFDKISNLNDFSKK